MPGGGQCRRRRRKDKGPEPAWDQFGALSGGSGSSLLRPRRPLGCRPRSPGHKPATDLGRTLRERLCQAGSAATLCGRGSGGLFGRRRRGRCGAECGSDAGGRSGRGCCEEIRSALVFGSRRRDSGGEEGRSAQLIVQRSPAESRRREPGGLSLLRIGPGGSTRRARLGAPPLRGAPAFSPPDGPLGPFVPFGRPRSGVPSGLPTTSAGEIEQRACQRPWDSQKRGLCLSGPKYNVIS